MQDQFTGMHAIRHSATFAASAKHAKGPAGPAGTTAASAFTTTAGTTAANITFVSAPVETCSVASSAGGGPVAGMGSSVSASASVAIRIAFITRERAIALSSSSTGMPGSLFGGVTDGLIMSGVVAFSNDLALRGETTLSILDVGATAEEVRLMSSRALEAAAAVERDALKASDARRSLFAPCITVSSPVVGMCKIGRAHV